MGENQSGVIRMGVIESQFAEIIWEREPISSGQLVALCAEKFGWKKPTTYTVLRRLCERGLFQNKENAVTSLMTREDYYAMQSSQFIDENFKGSLPDFLAAFTSRRTLSDAEVEELERLIAQSRGR